MKGFLKVIHNIIRGFVRLFVRLFILLIQALIYIVTFEPGKQRQITVRKAKRIRALTKFKLWVFDLLPDSVLRYLGMKDYKDYLNSHLKHGMQLCNERADRRAV